MIENLIEIIKSFNEDVTINSSLNGQLTVGKPENVNEGTYGFFRIKTDYAVSAVEKISRVEFFLVGGDYGALYTLIKYIIIKIQSTKTLKNFNYFKSLIEGPLDGVDTNGKKMLQITITFNYGQDDY